MSNAANPQEQEAKGKEELRRRDQELSDVRQIMDNPAGRRLLWRYYIQCGIMKTSFDPSDHTGFMIHFNEGKRTIGLMILLDMEEANPDMLLSMMRENHKEK